MRKEKKTIRALIFEKSYSGHMRGFSFEDLPKDLQPKDFIEFEGWDEEFRSDGGMQAGAQLRIFRYRLETDDEFKKDVEFWEQKRAESKEERRKQYFKLKKEFENEPLQKDPSAKTSIPKDKWGVHRTHCCIFHGCKYGNKDCPVTLQLIEQKYSCEDCDDVNEPHKFVPKENRVYMCSICHENPVDAENGIDTCQICAKEL